MPIAFRDRVHAGQQLARELGQYARQPDTIVLGLARGGVPVASEVARLLDLPLDVFVVRKLGVPGQEELAMGAIASGGIRVLDTRLISQLHISDALVAHATSREHRELQRREDAYRDTRPTPDVHGQTVVLVDDGLATGASMFAAVAALRAAKPARIVVAVPVASQEACAAMRTVADDCVCALVPKHFVGVGAWYADFSQTGDAEVRSLLDAAARRSGAARDPRQLAPVREPLAAPPY
ncbi:MAG TPA: phosphoribosyltransferase [Gemmatimonadaceae bacterium]|nr:phosphoribosyltransferase [Gemmatimonadaceae bacterium]